jgi:hypothetical protein
MKKITHIKILFLIFYFSSHTMSQSLVSSSGEFGYFLHHSENSLPITENNKFVFHYGANIGLVTALTSEYNILVDIGYFQADVDRLFDFNFSTLSNPNIITTQSAKLIQRSFPVDFSISPNSASVLNYALGISFVYTNREMNLPYKYQDDPFVDKFNSFGIGVNLILRATYPLFGSDKFKLLCSSKFRYIHSILYESKGRDLSGYELNYFQTIISLGIEYQIN